MADDPLRVNALALADEFDRRAAEVRREAEEKAQAYEAQAAQLRSAVGERDEGLSFATDGGIVSHKMQQGAYQEFAKLQGRPPKSEHPFAKALKAKRMPLAQWARAHGLKRQRVLSWFLDGDGGRQIPRAFADEIEREFGIPATAKTWRNGIKE